MSVPLVRHGWTIAFQPQLFARQVVELKAEVKRLKQELDPQSFVQATQIVGFFDKWEEVKRIEQQIKRAILDQPFGSNALVAAVTQRFMELGKRHFR